ncbi:MAG: VOC family protein [Saprospiraceae bacterium]
MSSPKKIKGHQTVIPYIRIENPRGFIKWTEAVFGAQENEVVTSDDGTVRHAQILIDDAIIMMSTAREEWPVDNASFYIYVDSTAQTYQKAIEMGAKSVFEPFDEDYGAKSAGLKDPFGNHWWLSELI